MAARLLAIRFLLILATLYMLLMVVHYPHKAITARSHPWGVDWIGFWAGTRCWERGANMYDPASAQAIWQALKPPYARFISPQVYPPHYALVYAPFLFLSLPRSLELWLAFSILCAALFAWLLVRMYGRAWPLEWKWAFTVMVGASNGVLSMLAYGNPAVVNCAFLAASVWAMRRNRWVLAGLLLAVASIKWTLLIPFTAYFLLRGRWRPVALAFALAALLIVVSGEKRGVARNLTEMRSGIQRVMVTGASGEVAINDPRPRNTSRLEIVDGETFWYDVLGDRPALVQGVHLLIMALTGAAILWLLNRRRGMDELLALSLAIVWSLLAFYHRRPDCLLCAFPLAYCINRLRNPEARRRAMASIGAIGGIWYVFSTMPMRLWPYDNPTAAFTVGFGARLLTLALMGLLLAEAWHSADRPAEAVVTSAPEKVAA